MAHSSIFTISILLHFPLILCCSSCSPLDVDSVPLWNSKYRQVHVHIVSSVSHAKQFVAVGFLPNSNILEWGGGKGD